MSNIYEMSGFSEGMINYFGTNTSSIFNQLLNYLCNLKKLYININKNRLNNIKNKLNRINKYYEKESMVDNHGLMNLYYNGAKMIIEFTLGIQEIKCLIKFYQMPLNVIKALLKLKF